MARLSAEAFIRVWQTASSVDDVAAKTKIDRMSACRRASVYRKMGIPLKKFSRGPRRLDVKRLAAIAKKLGAS